MTDRGYDRFERFLRDSSRRDFLRGVGAAAALAAFGAGGVEALAACGGQPSTTTSVTPRRGGKIVAATIADPKTFNSVLSNDNASNYVITRILDPLLGYDAAGNQVGRIATGPAKISPDGLTFTFTLRKDVKWTDGQPLTSDDVRFTYDLSFDPKYTAVKSQQRQTYTQYIQELQNPDPYTFIVKLKKIYAPFATTLGVGPGILPKHVLGGLTGDQINTADWNTNPTVTSGPFKFVEWKKGQQVTMGRNDSYYRGAPYLDTWLYLIVGSSLDIFNKLTTGEVDVATIDPSQADQARSVSHLDLVSFPGFNYEYIAFNLRQDHPASAFFQDVRVRQAMMHALDRAAMAKAIYFTYAAIADSAIPPLSWAYNKDATPRYGFDKAKAMQLLDGAGWKVGSSGIREKDGKQFKIQMITNAGNKVRENLLLALQQAWKDVGIDATPNYVDFNKVLVPALLDNRNFDLAMSGLGFGIDPNPDQFHSRNIPAGNFNSPGWSNPQADKLIDDAVATYDRAKRKAIYFQLQNIINEEPSQPPLFFGTGPSAINKRVKNYVFSPFVTTSFFARDVFVTDGK
ncbi:MAG TPA: ABC transporter substrate-binding protein [Terriglobales bacterium]|nr:ABC transporter substrate-binding protein [Terriglobales bacterium]